MAAHQEAAQTIQMLFWAQVWLIHDKLQQCRIVLLTLTRAKTGSMHSQVKGVSFTHKSKESYIFWS